MSFERHNLHLSAAKREGTMDFVLRDVLDRKRAAVAARRAAEPTLIYCLSITEVKKTYAVVM